MEIHTLRFPGGAWHFAEPQGNQAEFRQAALWNGFDEQCWILHKPELFSCGPLLDFSAMAGDSGEDHNHQLENGVTQHYM